MHCYLSMSFPCQNIQEQHLSSMEIPPIGELPEMGLMENPNIFNQWRIDELSVLPVPVPVSASFGDNSQHYEASSSRPATIDRPQKQLKITNGRNSCRTHILTDIQSSFSPHTLPFPSSNYNPFGNQNFLVKGYHDTNNRISQSKDHIMAERKRREKLSEKFIALSALVPGLKKMDKATVLGDAIKYMKQLQEKVKTLEEQARQKSIESVVFVKKYQLLGDINDELSSWDEICAPFDEPLPEIEARFCDQSVLISIHCEKRKGFPEKIISAIEKFNLTVINSNVMTFGSCAHITIVAQMDMEFCMTVKELVKNLRSSYIFLV
ncbi:transcription factor bHLH19 isoform X1 [Gossypium hirsutum]|uniref:Transcription factor bHLH19 isoform X1 n=4 Tax=Gossypium TaxID=3633 RepID=A0ABM3BKN1_GOSHI|nr:transcription factor bHLH19-like isoform X1 [Gossypium hirsutum]